MIIDKRIQMKRIAVSVAIIIIAIANISPAEIEIKDIKWKLGPNLPEFRKGGCATVLGGKVISVFGMRQPWGEMATMYIYDPQTDWWYRGPDAPVGQCYVQGTESGSSFYTIGGRGALQRGKVHNACYRFQQKNGKYNWSQIQGLNEPRGWAPSVSIGSKLYVIGGSKGGHGPCISSVEMLDTAAPQARWQKIADIPGQSRGWLGAAAVKGKIYVFGGSHFFEPKPENGPGRKQFKDVYQFEPKTAKWQIKSLLPYRLSGMDSCVYNDRYIIVVGGYAAIDDYDEELMKQYKADRFHKSYYCPFVLVYDTKTDKWYLMPSLLPVPTNDIRVVIIGKKLYVLGGENIEPATSNTTPWLRIGEIIE